jgi:sporulation protein YlmC with PRC-barrel domain
MFSNSPVKVSSLIGTDIYNLEGESLGSIKEVVVDPSTGRIAYVVVSFGGFLGLGEKLFAIPFAAFERDELKGNYILNIAKDKLIAAPGFDSKNWPSMSDEKWNRDMYSYYGHSPYWE